MTLENKIKDLLVIAYNNNIEIKFFSHTDGRPATKDCIILDRTMNYKKMGKVIKKALDKRCVKYNTDMDYIKCWYENWSQERGET